MNPKVSIIVPCYNAGRYLPQCLDSLLAQTLEEIEVLCIDDASTDDTRAVIARYAQRDTRVRVHHFEKNGGVSRARNWGLQNARGECIGFCDADDWVERPMFAQLYAAIAQAEVAFCAVTKNYENGRVDEVLLPWQDETRFDARGIREELIPAMLAQATDSDVLPVSGYTPRNLFRRSLLEASARFREDIHYAEDLLFIIQALLRAQAVQVVAARLYHYRFYGGSVTKRYSPHVPASHEKCHAALNEAFAAEGMDVSARMKIRGRKSALDAVKNLCLPGTPYTPWQRIVHIRAYLARADVRALFRGLALRRIAGTLRLKYAMMKYRTSVLLMLFFSYVFKNR